MAKERDAAPDTVRDGAHADADELDLRHDEPVPAGLLAHHPLQLCERAEVLDLLVRIATAFARVPRLVGFDQPDDPALRGCEFEGVGTRADVVAEEVGAIARGLGFAHVAVPGNALRDAQSGIDLGGVEVVDGILKVEEVVWVASLAFQLWFREEAGVAIDVEDLFEAGDGADSIHVEVRPAAQLANVPPVMLTRIVTRGPRA